MCVCVRASGPPKRQEAERRGESRFFFLFFFFNCRRKNNQAPFLQRDPFYFHSSGGCSGRYGGGVA